MLTLTHTIMGGAIGAEVDNPALAFSFGVMGHVITDKIPHFWPNEKKGKIIVMAIDGVLTVSALIAFLILFPDRPAIFWGGMGGAILDGLLVLTPLKKTKIGLWHLERQYHHAEWTYFATDILLIGASAGFYLWL